MLDNLSFMSCANSRDSGAGSRRVDWVDTAKGLAIVLVVIHHAVMFTVRTDLASPTWIAIDEAFQVFRMPLFFLASGLFARSIVRRRWRDLWSSRLSLLVWTFGVWSVLRYTWFLAVPSPIDPHETDLVRLVGAPLWPASGLWFLHALVGFFVLTKLLTDRAPAWMVLVPAGLLSALWLSLPGIGNPSYDGMLRYYIFFAAGCFGREWIFVLAERLTWPRTAFAGGLFVFGALVLARTEAGRAPGVALGVSTLALAAGVGMTRAATRLRLVAPLTGLGRQTLAVYVAHVIVLAAMTTVLATRITPGHVVGALLPLLLALAAIVSTLTFKRIASLTPGGVFLYEAPQWFARPTRRTAMVGSTVQGAQPAEVDATSAAQPDSEKTRT